MNQFFASGAQSIGVPASASALPMNIQDLFPSGWTGWISLQSKGLSRVFFDTTVQKHQFFGAQLSLCSNCYPSLHLAGLSSLSHWSNFFVPLLQPEWLHSFLIVRCFHKVSRPFWALSFPGPTPLFFPWVHAQHPLTTVHLLDPPVCWYAS